MSILRLPILIFAATLACLPARAVEYVDLELVLAIDVSRSIDAAEADMQRQGYITALTNPKVIGAIRSGILGRIAVTYLEWAGSFHKSVVVSWQMIDGEATAHAFAAALTEMPISRERSTSITRAIAYAVPMFEGNGFEGTRRVIDVSGDGPNNTGGLVTYARDGAVAAGITINGLPIINDRNLFWGSNLKELDLYYIDCVIGGPGAFVVVAEDFYSFADAIRRKLVLEIAGRTPALEARLWRVAERVAPPCDIGERRREQRRRLRSLGP